METTADFAASTTVEADQDTHLPDGMTTASVPVTAEPKFLRLSVEMAR